MDKPKTDSETQINYFDHIPDELLIQILDFASPDVQIHRLVKVGRRYFSTAATPSFLQTCRRWGKICIGNWDKKKEKAAEELATAGDGQVRGTGSKRERVQRIIQDVSDMMSSNMPYRLRSISRLSPNVKEILILHGHHQQFERLRRRRLNLDDLQDCAEYSIPEMKAFLISEYETQKAIVLAENGRSQEANDTLRKAATPEISIKEMCTPAAETPSL